MRIGKMRITKLSKDFAPFVTTAALDTWSSHFYSLHCCTSRYFVFEVSVRELPDVQRFNMLGNMLPPVCDHIYHILAPCAIFQSSSSCQRLTIPNRLCVDPPRFRLWLQQRGIRYQHHFVHSLESWKKSPNNNQKKNVEHSENLSDFVCLFENLPFCMMDWVNIPPFSRLEAGKSQAMGHMKKGTLSGLEHSSSSQLGRGAYSPFPKKLVIHYKVGPK